MKVVIDGVGGRMGNNILNAAYADMQTKIVGATEIKDHSLIGADVCTVLGCSNMGVEVVDDLRLAIEKAYVVINFTSPEATLAHLKIAHEHKKRMVIGTTGFLPKHLAQVKKVANDIPVVLAPNMGVGVNLMLKVAADVAEILGNDYDIEIMEIHHNQKKDAPSGTAMRLAEVISDALKRNLEEVGVYGRKGITGVRSRSEIGIHALRGGDVIGEHTVYFIGGSERIELTHRAQNRMAFARGAIRAAKFLMNEEPGKVYDMQDVLGL